jgi:NADPH2 dehydrogenase
MADSRLFQPLKIGNMEVKNRIAMAPLTRFRGTDDHIPIVPMVAEYYAQRASVPGTLLITEATFISPDAAGAPNVPGIWKQEQIDAWRKVTDAVHAKGSFIYLQLWALGRVADVGQAEKENFTIMSASPIPAGEGYPTPKEMTEEDIKKAIGNYAQAAKNSIAAGFDGVEIHGANGYLVDQFLQDNSNQRTDSYGGSVENRSRFAHEVTKAVVEAVGADRTGIRLSPFSEFQGMKMKDPIPQFSDIIKKLAALKLAYLHLVELLRSWILSLLFSLALFLLPEASSLIRRSDWWTRRCQSAILSWFLGVTLSPRPILFSGSRRALISRRTTATRFICQRKRRGTRIMLLARSSRRRSLNWSQHKSLGCKALVGHS